MSARDWRAVREGETHAASRTSTNRTPESFIVGVGASGALLASAAIVFVTLVGLVSFNVWPSGREVSVDGNVELSNPTPGGAQTRGAAPLSAAAGQLASTAVGSGSGTGTGSGAGGRGHAQAGGNGGNPKGSRPKSGVTGPQSTTTPPPSPVVTGDTGSTGSTGSTGDSGGSQTSPPETASKDPAHPVHPARPDTPHQNVSTGTNGKQHGSTSDAVVTGKGPFSKPTLPSSP
ncbi:MAG: hypothetical protein WBQ41_16145, partial [Solirubrobacterales bacterium]